MLLESIITSEVRIRILIELFSETEKQLYVREITRRVGTEINAVRRELKRLTKAGVIRKEKRGNRLYYIVREDYPFYYELTSIVAKEVGIGSRILESRANLGKIRIALLALEYVQGRQSDKGELDLLFVGDVNLPELSSLIKEESKKTGRDINYTILKSDEFEYLKKRKDTFVLSFLVGQNVVLIGDARLTHF